jgi:hypothetical protein
VRAARAECGSPYGAQRHRRAGEPACGKCEAAYRLDMNLRREAMRLLGKEYPQRLASLYELARALGQRPETIWHFAHGQLRREHGKRFRDLHNELRATHQKTHGGN